jgi:hypothetical protein
MMPDLTKLLDIAGPKALGLFFACLLIKLANSRGLISLTDISSSAAAINDVVMIVAGALAVVWLVEMSIRRGRRALAQRRYHASIREFLSTLSYEEQSVLLAMMARNQQSTTMELADPIAARLVHKGLLKRAPGVGHAFAWTFTIPTEVWHEMQLLWPEALLSPVDDPPHGV